MKMCFEQMYCKLTASGCVINIGDLWVAANSRMLYMKCRILVVQVAEMGSFGQISGVPTVLGQT